MTIRHRHLPGGARKMPPAPVPRRLRLRFRCKELVEVLRGEGVLGLAARVTEGVLVQDGGLAPPATAAGHGAGGAQGDGR